MEISVTWTTPIDIYCERIGAGFWDEPVNALTNLAFIIAGVMAFRLVKNLSNQSITKDWDLYLLSFLIVVIGAGSFLFHTFANKWSMLADDLPIGLFINLYLFSFMYRVAGWQWWKILAGFAAFHAMNYGITTNWQGAFNGSIAYAPGLITLAVIVIYASWLRLFAAARLYLIAVGIFVASISLRSVDMAMCTSIPLGTHFAWHLLNAAMLYILVRVLVSEIPQSR